LEPLTDEARKAIQARVDAYYDSFVSDVAKGRGVSAETVRNDYGEGATLLAKGALQAGMVDGIQTLDGVLRLMSKTARRNSPAATEGAVDVGMGGDGTALHAEDEDPRPFRERVAMLEADARSISEHGLVRAQLRAKEGRPAFSDTTLSALRSTRDAISALLPDEPVATPRAVDPPPVQPQPQPVAAVASTPRFQSKADWFAYLERKIQ
jgi:ClpP class serine protease